MYKSVVTMIVAMMFIGGLNLISLAANSAHASDTVPEYIPEHIPEHIPEYSSKYAPEYVGAKQCANCHEQAYESWQGSHHDMSMKHADEKSVLGDFNHVTFADNTSKLPTQQSENKFYKKGDQFWVHIKGDDGKFHDYQI